MRHIHTAQGVGAFAVGVVQRHRARGQRRIERCKTVQRVIGHGKACFGHAQRVKNTGLEKRIQRLPRHRFDHAADHVDAHGILPPRAGLKCQGQLCQVPRDLGQTGLGCGEHQLGLFHRLGQHAGVERIAETAGVGHGLVQRWHGTAFDLINRRGPVHQRVHLGKFRQHRRQRRIQMDQPLFHQHHQRQRGDRLGHRIDPRHRVAGKRRAAGHIAQTGFVIEHLLAGLFDQNRAPWIFLFIYIGLHPGFDAVQSGLVQCRHVVYPIIRAIAAAVSSVYHGRSAAVSAATAAVIWAMVSARSCDLTAA